MWSVGLAKFLEAVLEVGVLFSLPGVQQGSQIADLGWQAGMPGNDRFQQLA